MFLALGLAQFAVARALRTSGRLGAGGGRFLWLSVSGAACPQLAATYLPPLQEIVGTVALPLADLLFVVALAAIPAVVVRLGRPHLT